MEVFSQAKKFILDTLFPVRCLFCQKEDFWVCVECLEKIEVLLAQACPYCEEIETPSGKICPRCKNKILYKNSRIPIDNLVASVKYSRNSISHLVHLFKYRFISDLREPLGKLMVKAIVKNNLPLPDLIIPVPLHKKRLRWRGFNQSELLAKFISQNLAPGLEIPVSSDVISRKKYTQPQMKIKNYKERQKNILNIFEINKDSSYNLENKTILLVDDIATTGSTLFECGRVLKFAGAGKIIAAVIARQEMK